MDITITAQKPVSEFLNVAQGLITEVQEWASVLWVRVLGCRPRFVSKKAIKIMISPKRKSLLPDAYKKPQNQISEIVRNKVKKQVSEWMQSLGMDFYNANLLSSPLLEKAIAERISMTHSTAPSIYLSDADKVDSLVMSAKKIADALDEKGELEDLLNELANQEERNQGNL